MTGLSSEVEAIVRSPNEDEWDFSFEGAIIDDASSRHPRSGSITLPKQLHPAVSMGMSRVSTCYFSINGSEATTSVADLLSLLEHETNNDTGNIYAEDEEEEGIDILYHDILMHVFTFLDANALRQFSQTARRPNFECFYFLQLQLQRAMLAGSSGDDDEVGIEADNTFTLDHLAGSGCLSRLAEKDEGAADDILQGYLNSNSSLKVMPLSHSLAYLRHVLQRNGFQQHVTSRPQSQALASAAFVITMVGAASSFMGDIDAAYLFRVGLAGSLVAGTAKKMQEPNSSMRETAEDMARMMQELPSQMWQQLQQKAESSSKNSTNRRRSKRKHQKQQVENSLEEEKSFHDGEEKDSEDAVSPDPYVHEEELKMPSGCVGAYSRAVHDASSNLCSLLREERKRNYEALSEDERLQVSQQFIQACTSDDFLDIVKDMVVLRKCIDVDGFYIGPDGQETCALHTAAFNGACRVVEFLVGGIDENSPDQDGGLADVNIRDANNWTAMHFCAGANAVEAVRILANHGAQLALEANNGYTPFHWAQRLSNNEVAEELQRLGADQRFLEMGWLRNQQPLSAIASRFFAMMPSH